MEIKFKVIVNIPAESVEALGISEDTLFKTSFENGRLYCGQALLHLQAAIKS